MLYSRTAEIVYNHVNENNNFRALETTRHFGPMLFYLCWNKKVILGIYIQYHCVILILSWHSIISVIMNILKTDKIPLRYRLKNDVLN